MNTERYLWPVIIAAGLHGALLLSFGDRTVIAPVPKTKDVPWERPPIPPDPLPVDLTDPDPANDSTSGTAGGPVLLPALPDVPAMLPREDIFIVRVTECIIPINPVEKLPKDMGDLSGPGNGPRGVPGIPDFRSLDRIPRAVVQTAPGYPDAMRKSATSGSVTVEFIVDTTGRVVSAEAVRWTHREFVDPAVRAVLRWRFEPGTLNGRKVSFRMAVPIEYNAAL